MDSSEKLREAIPRLVEELRNLIDEFDVTMDEWMQILGFLTRVGRANEFVLLSDVLHISVHVDAREHENSSGTASNVEGPFYDGHSPELEPPYQLGRSLHDAPVFILSGHVKSTSGEPLPGARIDIWQSDHHGVYDHQSPDIPQFDLRGKLHAADDGSYEVRAPIPAPYEVKNDGPVGRMLEVLDRHAFRPAHVHVKVEAAGHRALTTMLFIPGDPWLDDDTIDAVKDELVLELQYHDDSAGLEKRGLDRPVATAEFDFVLVPID